MILLYTEHISERLNYICHFILREQLGITYTITTQKPETEESSIFIINYSNQSIAAAKIIIRPQGLLFEQDIKPQNINCDQKENRVILFKTENDDLGFDLFSATFYLISRYEEYLPHQKDEYGRYDFKESIAYKNGFLKLPLVNIWIELLASEIKKHHPECQMYRPPFKTIVSYDIDMAWSYKNKGILRNIGGFIRKPSIERLKVLWRIRKDPFDSFDLMDTQNQKNKFETIYFFLVAKSLGEYDKNISPSNQSMRKLINQKASRYNIGLHPSWKSNSNPLLLNEEKKQLERISKKAITNSRQHYIKLNLPETYRKLIKNEINNDFSMGYGNINGFRASAASSFFWFDLKENKTTSLRLYPFCFMDATSHYSLNQSAEEGSQELFYFKNICQQYDGLFISIFHNNIIGDEKTFKGWKETYLKFIVFIVR